MNQSVEMLLNKMTDDKEFAERYCPGPKGKKLQTEAFTFTGGGAYYRPLIHQL